ncbi:heptahelical transmembrane protein 4-like [Phalaenopsis equestris]|uniref:heptahelical transmembrane protein 4-like n=1 Tax=Phalaenopsis equestris TaxID=78828 RepID=UPI0009E49C7B|nr:heptahelical transmembrane protein 4-like [Phalaenopsis equestris]
MCLEVATMASSVCLEIISTSSSPAEESEMQFLISPRFIESGEIEKTSAKKTSYKFELVDYDSLPEFLKHNEFILNHYRSEWPLKQTLLSIFSIHNETLNIWTHLIGFFIFLVLAFHASTLFPVNLAVSGNSSSTFGASTSGPIVSLWPFYLYLIGAMFCLLSSCACHLLCCHSSFTCYLTLRLDYAGISVLIVSSFYPLVYYSFACLPFYRNLYLCSITLLGITTIIVSLSPFFESAKFRAARAVLFACMGASGLVPIVHKMVAFGDRKEAVVSTLYEVAMGLCYGVGAVVYGARVPERWIPGKFDIAGHSHQLFHVLVVAGAYMHYLASLVYLEWREIEAIEAC